MNRKKKGSISSFLVSLLGLLMMCKVFIWVLESQVLHVPIPMPELNYAIIFVMVLLLLRIGFVWWRIQRKKASSEASVVDNVNNPNSENKYVCATCGITVSEKVKQYCLSRPGRFQGKIYCYDHQASQS